jgi:hypothetical protein
MVKKIKSNLNSIYLNAKPNKLIIMVLTFFEFHAKLKKENLIILIPFHIWIYYLFIFIYLVRWNYSEDDLYNMEYLIEGMIISFF